MPQIKFPQSKLSDAQKQFDQAKARLLDAKAQAKNQERRQKRTLDNRRKILVGAWALAEMGKNADFRTLALASLEGFLTREIDRATFPELREPKPKEHA